eukprot:COSAG06_NODE_50563_length_318_cov_0.401826_1_plen_42_part_10
MLSIVQYCTSVRRPWAVKAGGRVAEARVSLHHATAADFFLVR